jgi:hypothetical protein
MGEETGRAGVFCWAGRRDDWVLPLPSCDRPCSALPGHEEARHKTVRSQRGLALDSRSFHAWGVPAGPAGVVPVCLLVMVFGGQLPLAGSVFEPP